MKKNLLAVISLSLSLAVASQPANALIYPLPIENNNIIGQNLRITLPEPNRLPLEAFAAQYQMGLSNMLEANAGVDVYLPKSGSQLTIPHQLILPDAPREGMVINSAEMRLYYYPKGSKSVVVLPIGIGELGKDTPLNWVTTVQSKRANPTWTPTKTMHAEYASRGLNLPTTLPAGPDNPMGLYALYIGRLYAIHGTNADFGIGLRVSHGCVRLRAADIKWLFEHVPVGTRVQFINQPVKASVEADGSRYIEVHNPLSTSEEQFRSNQQVPINLTPAVSKILGDASVDQNLVNQALQQRAGMPIKINSVTQHVETSLPKPIAASSTPVDTAN